MTDDELEVRRLRDHQEEALFNLRNAVDPFKAPEEVARFVRAALAELERAEAEASVEEQITPTDQ